MGFVRRDDLVGARQNHPELVAAETPDHVGRACVAAQYVGDVNQRGANAASAGAESGFWH